jgi:hypothetical protein
VLLISFISHPVREIIRLSNLLFTQYLFENLDAYFLSYRFGYMNKDFTVRQAATKEEKGGMN